jgi:hypothetical protein
MPETSETLHRDLEKDPKRKKRTISFGKQGDGKVVYLKQLTILARINASSQFN